MKASTHSRSLITTTLDAGGADDVADAVKTAPEPPPATLETVQNIVSGSATPKIDKPYLRPSHATSKTQRASVQGQPCTTCGESAPKMYADHKTPLVQEYYETGHIDHGRMHAVEAVQPQCPTCSNRQGAEFQRYSREMKGKNGL